MYLAITLNKLQDFDNSCAAFQKAVDMDGADCTIYLNYAIVLYNNGLEKRAREMFEQAEKVYTEMEEEDVEPEMQD